MEDLKLLLIDRLKSKGMDPELIPAYLKALTSIITSEPGITPAQANRKLHSLGWNEVAIDYHCLQIAIACQETEPRHPSDNATSSVRDSYNRIQKAQGSFEDPQA
jgi:hypothetical protein